MKKYTLLAILMCFSVVAKAQTSSGKHHIKYLDINSGNPDKGVSFISDKEVVFTTTISDRVINTEKYNPYLDFYKGTVGEDGAILDKQRLNVVKDKKVSKNAATFTKDARTVYFSANKYSKRKSKQPRYELFKASIDENGDWTEIEKLPFVNRRYSYSYPAVNKDHTRLYFSSNAAPSNGGTDIFYVDINEDGTYGDPVNLGSKINTYGNETTPFIADNNFLYFSSDGRDDSMGGLDVYTVEAFENTFSDPLHLASPINSINDDLAYIVNADNKGFFSSNRLQGRDNDDIYSFYIEPDKPVECLQEIVGTVRDKETEELITNAQITVVDDQGNEVQNVQTDATGNYRFTLSCRNTFTVTATKLQYDKEEHIVNTANYFDAPPLEVNQSLEKQIQEISEEKVVIKANPIYFRFDKHNISKEAATELDRIVEIMKQNPGLMIEAASHTDSRGPRAYNQKLSERRAQSTVNYIVSKGISKDRITAKGYGESQLINNCKDGIRCGIEKHKLNRRTEFVILNKQALKQNTVTPKSLAKSNSDSKVISTPKVTTASPKSPVKEGTSNDSSKGEIIFLNTETPTETENAPNEDQEEDKTVSISTAKNTELKATSNLEEPAELIPPVAIDIDHQEVPTASEEATEVGFRKTQKDPKELSTAAPKVRGKKYGKPVLVENTKERSSLENNRDDINLKKEQLNAEQMLKPDRLRLAESKLQQSNIPPKDLNPNTQQTTTRKPTPASDFSVSEQTETESTTIEKEEVKLNEGFNKDFSNTENHMKSVSENLFSEDDEFESFDDKTITANRYASKVRDSGPNPASYDEAAIYRLQKTIVKKQFVESTKNISKDEVIVVNSIDVSPMNVSRRGKYRITEFANKVDVMRINFQIDNNERITPGYKEVYILIQNPKGTILNRKGSFKMNNGETLTYTEKTNAYYNNNHLNLSMMTDRFIQKISKGVYTVIIYIEGYPVGLEMVTLH